jgi:hypothetical protein
MLLSKLLELVPDKLKLIASTTKGLLAGKDYKFEPESIYMDPPGESCAGFSVENVGLGVGVQKVLLVLASTTNDVIMELRWPNRKKLYSMSLEDTTAEEIASLVMRALAPEKIS